MCSECGDSECGAGDEPLCSWCGTECYGHCADPDTCESCWSYKNDPMGMFMDRYDDEGMDVDECMDEGCQCECHDEMYADLGMRFEHGVLFTEDDYGYEYVREGVFPFLKLPGEIRDKIYGFAFLQDGNRRDMPNKHHRGTIHTALLGTCRQVYQEAGHLPLSLNTINFSSALYGLDFLGFSLVPSKKELVTSVHVEFYYSEFSTTSWQLLIKHLAKMPIRHFGLIIKGGYTKEAFLGHKCFANRFATVMKGIKSFNVILSSGLIGKKAKEAIQEEMRETLIEGYRRPKETKGKKTKRNATSETRDKTPAKKAKKAIKVPKHQTKLVLSPKTPRLGMKSQKPEREAAEAAKNRLKQVLLAQYDQLKQYATSMDFDAAPVKIRLEDARKAAEAVDELRFLQLARSISVTLEERFDSIAVARSNVPKFAGFLHIAGPIVAKSFQESVDLLTTPSSSHSSMC